MEARELALPSYADTVIVGGGTAGAAMAGRLAERSDRTVLLLEAGPDYGPLSGGQWPPELLDGRKMALTSHSWGYTSAARHGEARAPLPRARVLGGCSAHNGCFAVWGQRADYDGWERAGNPGWGADALQPLFRAANERMRVSVPDRDRLQPLLRATLDAAEQAGYPFAPDVNDLDLQVAATIAPTNIVGDLRWNVAFAYLDPVRDRRSLTIRDRTLVDRLVIEHGRSTGVDVIGPAGASRVHAGRVVLCAGAYATPALLLRSGIGEPEALRPLGITPLHALPGVGQHLQDHAVSEMLFAGSERIVAELEAFIAAGGMFREDGTIIRARSATCSEGADLQLYAMCTQEAGTWAEPHFQAATGGWLFGMWAVGLAPRSAGSVRLVSADPEAAPEIDSAFLTDPEGHDLEALVDGVERMRALAAQPALAEVLGRELAPGSGRPDRAQVRAYVRDHSLHDYHPVGTCKMGPANDPLAVVDARGQVHGIEGLFVADASIMPTIPRGNTNLPTLVIAEKIAALLAEDDARGR